MAAEGVFSVVCAADSLISRTRHPGTVPYLLAVVHLGGIIYANWLFKSNTLAHHHV